MGRNAPMLRQPMQWSPPAPTFQRPRLPRLSLSPVNPRRAVSRWTVPFPREDVMAEAIAEEIAFPVRVAARPSHEEFEKIVKQNQGRILRLALGMLRDRDAAEDVAQETFVRAFRFYETFRSDAALFTWLYRIAMNLCLDAQRKSRLRPAVSLDEMDEARDGFDPSPTPEGVLEIRQLARHAEAALEMLTPNHRAILLLREVEGLSYEEISRVLRSPKGTVMSRLYHARMNMQRAARALAG